MLFDDTIANNIAYGAPEAIAAGDRGGGARGARARVHPGAAREGYETRIGERGQRLSGGQRQRLAIARALLKNSPILILDEATSSLDAESELLVQDALANLMRNRTAFVIAHRLSTVRRADAIVALERGRVAEIGRHEELLAKPAGVYAKLYALQIFDQRSEPADAGRGHRDSMIKSMTGFASLTRDEDPATISVTIRAVNHRFLDVQLRTPPALARSSRGCGRWCSSRSRADGSRSSISVQSRADNGVDIEVNEAVIEAVARAGARARARPGRRRADAGDLLRFPQAITHQRARGTRRGSGDARRRSKRRSPPRSTSSIACGAPKGRTCGPSWTRGAASSATCSIAPRGGGRGRRGAARAAGGARAGAARRPGRRRGGDRAGDRALREPVGHHRGDGPVPRRTSSTGARCRTRPSRAAASSTSSCRR